MRIIIKNLQKKIPINLKKIKLAVLKTLSCEGVSPVRNTKSLKSKGKISNGVRKRVEITILFINDKQIRELNLMYRGYDIHTDVISFDNSKTKKEILADIAISTDTAVRNALIFKTTPLYEVYLYIIHGILHLLGYDDTTSKQKKLMENKEQEILSNIKNVYT